MTCLVHSPFSYLLGSNICLRVLSSNTLSLHSSLNVRDHVSQPYSTTGNIIVLYVLIFRFLHKPYIFLYKISIRHFLWNLKLGAHPSFYLQFEQCVQERKLLVSLNWILPRLCETWNQSTDIRGKKFWRSAGQGVCFRNMRYERVERRRRGAGLLKERLISVSAVLMLVVTSLTHPSIHLNFNAQVM